MHSCDRTMISQLGQELYKASHRILDHHVFINGEIESFLENFETKRKDIEIDTLFQVATNQLDLSERCSALSSGKESLDEINTELGSLLTSVNALLEKVQVEREPGSQLQLGRRTRAERKAEFLQNLQHGYQRIENSFEEKEEEIAELYSDLQLKLNIPK